MEHTNDDTNRVGNVHIDLVQVTKIHFFIDDWCREYELLKIGSW